MSLINKEGQYLPVYYVLISYLLNENLITANKVDVASKNYSKHRKNSTSLIMQLKH